MPLTVVQLRGGLPETFHPVSAALSDGARTLWSVGPDDACFWRSGCKPLQLTTSLEQLPADAVAALEDADLAVGASSHSGQPMHVARVRALLGRFGLGEDGLRCGAHAPIHEASARAVETPGAIHNNCSGKHTFMLAAARAQGWDADYLPPDHPLQQRNRARIRAWTDSEPGLATDGCGVPTFHVTVSGMARAFGRLAVAMAEGDGLPARIGWAMSRRPELVSGEGRLDLAVTTQATEPLACKIGAEGLFDIALPHRKLGLVVKVWTGNADALAVAVRAVLAEVAPGVLPAPLPWETVSNVAGRVVGERKAVWS